MVEAEAIVGSERRWGVWVSVAALACSGVTRSRVPFSVARIMDLSLIGCTKNRRVPYLGHRSQIRNRLIKWGLVLERCLIHWVCFHCYSWTL